MNPVRAVTRQNPSHLVHLLPVVRNRPRFLALCGHMPSSSGWLLMLVQPVTCPACRDAAGIQGPWPEWDRYNRAKP